ncbi:hypothetical protein LshimejAT787_0212310 [Lyophyllum shimeji]|uniref:Uncharacterized protein n=1 Tax=Lyophyllum shimeji TaxID=47721 RepID=A0A9P3ULS4_LYOSH|nr:hypothetical protein LshimejAT787_0212310 [Lyophyllum shimeji]
MHRQTAPGPAVEEGRGKSEGNRREIFPSIVSVNKSEYGQRTARGYSDGRHKSSILPRVGAEDIYDIESTYAGVARDGTGASEQPQSPSREVRVFFGLWVRLARLSSPSKTDGMVPGIVGMYTRCRIE